MWIGIEHIKNTNDKMILWLFSLYFVLKPFYFWQSGMPQVADLILILAVVLYIFKNRFHLRFSKDSSSYIYTSFIFVSYVILINTIWSLVLNGELGFFKVSAFYLFNFMASLMVIILYWQYKEDTLRFIYSSVLVSIIIQLLIYLLGGGFTGSRMAAFFNNPNQLGYHSLLTLAFLLYLGTKIKKVSTAWFIIGIFAATVLCFVSLSKAAIVSYAGMLTYYVFIKRKSKIFTRRMLIFLLIAIILTIAIYQFNNDIISTNKLLQGVYLRILNIGQDNDDNLYARGYGRIIRYPQYLIFGAGEGIYSRFGSRIELHSTLGNIFMSYGIIGLVIYLIILFIAFKQNRWKDLYLLVFIMAYGLTHNGIRNSMLWILLALISIKPIPGTKERDKSEL